MSASNSAVITACKGRIDEPERQMLRDEEKMHQTARLTHTFEESFGLSMIFL